MAEFLVSDEDASCPIPGKSPVIIVTKRLSPYMVNDLFNKNILAIVSEEGGFTTHASILARSMGIPLMFNIPVTAYYKCNDFVIVDAENGKFILNPDQNTIIEHEKKLESFKQNEKKYKEIYKNKRAEEPDEKERRKKTKRTILEEPSEEVREYLYQLYGGKCQICGKTFPMRKDGKPFFIANYIVPRKLARSNDTLANALCLCPEHFAKWEHGSREAEDFKVELEKFKTKKEGGSVEFKINIKLCGEDRAIVYREKHALALQEFWKAQNK